MYMPTHADKQTNYCNPRRLELMTIYTDIHKLTVSFFVQKRICGQAVVNINKEVSAGLYSLFIVLRVTWRYSNYQVIELLGAYTQKVYV